MKAATLRAIRAKLNLKLPDFGKAVGYGPQSISEMERQVREIPTTLALAILAIDAGLSDPDPPDRILNKG
jgi:transcriptional regulator with XRE-family HTH domain